MNFYGHEANWEYLTDAKLDDLFWEKKDDIESETMNPEYGT